MASLSDVLQVEHGGWAIKAVVGAAQCVWAGELSEGAGTCSAQRLPSLDQPVAHDAVRLLD